MGCGGPRTTEEVKHLDLLDEASYEALVIVQCLPQVSHSDLVPKALSPKLYGIKHGSARRKRVFRKPAISEKITNDQNWLKM